MEKLFRFAFFSYPPPSSNDSIPYHAPCDIVNHVVRLAEPFLEDEL